MRDYLFRGKTEHGLWVYGSLIHVGDFCCILGKDDGTDYNYPYLDGDLGCIDGYATPVSPETVGQWTGLTDIYGQRIFEGDIHGMPGWVVTYCADVNEGIGMNAGWYVQRDNFESWMELENHTEHRIIGNIHDNPDLL
jgi:hypothetical protein